MFRYFISPKHSGEAVHGYELHKQQISQAGRGFSGLGVVALGALPQRVEEKELWERLVDCLERQLKGQQRQSWKVTQKSILFVEDLLFGGSKEEKLSAP